MIAWPSGISYASVPGGLAEVDRDFNGLPHLVGATIASWHSRNRAEAAGECALLEWAMAVATRAVHAGTQFYGHVTYEGNAVASLSNPAAIHPGDTPAHISAFFGHLLLDDGVTVLRDWIDAHTEGQMRTLRLDLLPSLAFAAVAEPSCFYAVAITNRMLDASLLQPRPSRRLINRWVQHFGISDHAERGRGGDDGGGGGHGGFPDQIPVHIIIDWVLESMTPPMKRSVTGSPFCS